MEKYVLDELDYKILNLISNDARISFLEVSRMCNISGAAVHQRVQKMIANNIIIGSEFILNLSKIGYNTCAFLELQFADSEDINDVIEKLKAIPEIVECHSMIGGYDLLVKLYAHNNAHLSDIIKNRIKPLGLVNVEATISCEETFRRQIRF
jgi:Lrp/AsnC family transcriptional regulator for asnA, asnC and gidA